MAQQKLLDGSAFQKFRAVIEAQGGNPQVMERFDLLPNATGAREIASPRTGYLTAIDASYIGQAAATIGGARLALDDVIDPAVGVILEGKVGQKVEEGAVLCRLYYTSEDNLDEAAAEIEDAFRISTQEPEERELILEVVG
jgi:thymidine phosphorylase